MLIHISGNKLYGKVDDVPGLFHIATVFYHINWLPLVPSKSIVVLAKGIQCRSGAEIRLNIKSTLLAWLRLAFIGASLVFLVEGIGTVLGGGASLMWRAMGSFGCAVAFGGVVFLSWRVRGLGRATYSRAIQIAENIGLNEEGLVMLELAFKRVSAADAKATLEQLWADAAAMAELAAQQQPGVGVAAGGETLPIAPPTSPSGR